MWWHPPFWLLTPSDLAFRRWRLELWLDIARSCGFRVMDSSGWRALRLKAAVRAEQVRVRIEAPGSPQSSVRVTAMFPGPPELSGLRIRRLASVPPWPRDLESGDELFDTAFSIEGPERLLRGLLDAEMRRLLVSVKAESRLEISRGELRLDTSDEELLDVLPLLLDIVRQLAQKVNVAQRLAENARCDPEAGVRLRNLLLLISEFPEAPEAAEALRAACSDASPQVRLRAALKRRASGRDILFELAESLEDDACSAQAVSRLGGELPFERTRTILNGALRRRLLQTAHACLEALGKSGDPAAVGILAKVLTLEKGELAAAAAQALGATGSQAALLPLQEVAKRSPNDKALQRATRQAIAEIKSRLPDASPGQLSLASSEAGQLSLATDPAGQLSLPPES